MVLLRNSLSLPLLFILASAFAFSTMAMIRDGEEVKESTPCEPSSSIQKWREVVGAHMMEVLPDFPSVLTCLIADYAFVPPLKIAAGHGYSAVIRDGKIFIWGYNDQGLLGNGTKENCSIPCVLPLEDNVTQVALGQSHVLAFTAKGALYSWGNNSFGKLGNGRETASFTPIQIPLKIDIDRMAAGSCHSIVLTCSGEVLAWGSHGVNGYNGKKGCRFSLTPKPVELPIEPSDRVKKIAARHNSSSVLTRSGRVFIWGENYSVPEEILIKGCMKIAMGDDFYLTINDQGEVWGWGRNNYRQLGNGSEESSPVPIPADIPAIVVKISAGEFHALALTDKGEVFSWGANWYGQLGLGDTRVHVKPTRVPLQHRVVDIVAGNFHCQVQTEDDQIFAWGLNQQGQLGIGTFVNSSTPVLVSMPDMFSVDPASAEEAE